LSMNYEAVTARYVDVRFERKKEVLEAYHGALKETASPKREATAPKPPRAPQRKKPMKWRVNCDKELFAAEGGVTECHAVFLRP
jgi:hypothetical protein